MPDRQRENAAQQTLWNDSGLLLKTHVPKHTRGNRKGEEFMQETSSAVSHISPPCSWMSETDGKLKSKKM